MPVEVGVEHGLLGERLGAKEAGALELGRAERGEEEEALGAGALGGAQQAQRPEAVDLLDAARRLVADRRREVDHRVAAAHGVPQSVGIGEVDERELHVDALGAEAARLAHERTHLMAPGEQQREQRRAHHPCRAGDKDHGAKLGRASSPTIPAPRGRGYPAALNLKSPSRREHAA